MLLGLGAPDSGTIRMFGSDLARNRTEVLHQVNFVASHVGLPGVLHVSEGDRVRELLLRLAGEAGRAMPVTSHNMREDARVKGRLSRFGE